MTGIWQPIGAPGERFLNRVVIDVTSKCNLSCAMCNRPDNDFDMPLELFGKIALETFPFTRSVWLSCGYEAFMARDFLAMAGYLKSAPDSLIITNGTLLNERNIRALIDSGLTRMVISFDGARKETFERIRKGSQFERVIANIGLLNRLKDALGSATPELLLTVTLMKSNLGEFADIVRQAAGLGIRTVKAKPLFVKVPSMGGEALEQCRDSARRSIAEARAAAQQLGICLEEALELKGLMENDRAGATAGPSGAAVVYMQRNAPHAVYTARRQGQSLFAVDGERRGGFYQAEFRGYLERERNQGFAARFRFRTGRPGELPQVRVLGMHVMADNHGGHA